MILPDRGAAAENPHVAAAVVGPAVPATVARPWRGTRGLRRDYPPPGPIDIEFPPPAQDEHGRFRRIYPTREEAHIARPQATWGSRARARVTAIRGERQGHADNEAAHDMQEASSNEDADMPFVAAAPPPRLALYWQPPTMVLYASCIGRAGLFMMRANSCLSGLSRIW